MTPLVLHQRRYEDHREHLADELARVDLLLKSETLRWRAELGSTKAPEHWGLLQVADAEVDAFLASAFRPPWKARELPPDAAGLRDAARRREESVAERVEATPTTVDLRANRLAATFALDRAGLDLVLMCYLGERDERYRRLYGFLQDDVSRDRPSVELALRVVGGLDTGAELLGPSRPLRRFHLLRLGGSDDAPVFARPLRLDERVARFLDGADDLEPAVLAAGLAVRPREPAPPPGALAAAARWLERREAPGACLLVSGAAGSGRLALAGALAARHGLALLSLDARRLAQSADGLETVLRLAQREALLRPAALFVAHADADTTERSWLIAGLLEELARFPGLLVLAGEALPEPSTREVPGGWLHVRLPPPTLADRQAAWERILTAAAPHLDPAPLARELAGKFEMTEGLALDATAAAKGLAGGGEQGEALHAADLVEAARRCSGQRLLRFGVRIEPREEASLEHLILPGPQRRQLAEVRERIRLRHRVVQEMGFARRLRLGRGFVALFAGASGVGKTMAAELLAKDQGIDLYKVDLALVVSKYVGETEKNLRQVFAEARTINAVVFFDEADALFGKRGEVKEARDRWANLEVNYLLQLVEEHDGVVILASNLRQNLDEAFLRRIQLVVEFPFPDAEGRRALWHVMWPRTFAPPEPGELALLAERFKLTGAAIRNIALDAAFRAIGALEVDPGRGRLDGRVPIALRDVVASAAREYQKLGRPVTEGEFGPLWYNWVCEDLF